MANVNSVVPKTVNLTVGTNAVALNSSTLSVAKFTVANNGTQAIYIGDSNVASNQCTVKLTAGSNYTFGETKFISNQTQNYDLPSFFARATASSQVLTITTYIKGGGTTASAGPF